MKDSPFIIYALPRSRTYWMSKFLSYQDKTCLHDITAEGLNIAGIRDILTLPNVGVADTGLVLGWQLMKAITPDAKIAVIRRPVDDVCASLAKFGIEARAVMEHRNQLLDQVSNEPGTLSVEYKDLDKDRTIKKLFEHCLEKKFDRKWWRFWKDKNLQIDMAARLAKLAHNQPATEALKAEAIRMMG